MISYRYSDDPARVFVAAEIGMTHDGSFGLACRLTEAAIDAGADIVKYQCHLAAAETRTDAPSPPYFTTETRYQYFERTVFSVEQFRDLVKLCHERDRLVGISTFSLEAIDVVVAAGADMIKIPSGEVTNLPLLRKARDSGLPVVLSSGMSRWNEVDAAVAILREAPEFCVLQCSSIYPCPAEKAGLNLIPEMATRYGCPVGFSDHTQTDGAAIAAVVMGARLVEKHFTIDRRLYGPDARFSTEPDAFARLVVNIRDAIAASRNTVNKDDVAGFEEMRRVFQKSIVLKAACPAGTVLTEDRLAFKKPGTGISPAELDSVLGRRLARALEADAIITWEDLEA